VTVRPAALGREWPEQAACRERNRVPFASEPAAADSPLDREPWADAFPLGRKKMVPTVVVRSVVMEVQDNAEIYSAAGVFQAAEARRRQPRNVPSTTGEPTRGPVGSASGSSWRYIRSGEEISGVLHAGAPDAPRPSSHPRSAYARPRSRTHRARAPTANLGSYPKPLDVV